MAKGRSAGLGQRRSTKSVKDLKKKQKHPPKSVKDYRKKQEQEHTRSDVIKACNVKTR